MSRHNFAHLISHYEGGSRPDKLADVLEPRMGSRSHNGDRTINAAGFDLLLSRLDADRDRAAQAYERLRRALLRFFDCRGVWPPDECADETLDRLAQQLDAHRTIDDLHSYAYGVARMILLERQRRLTLDPLDDLSDRVPAPAPEDEERERVSARLERCLDELHDDSRSLLLRYYEGERHSKIANRRRLATTLGVSESALRSRVQRLRDRLERCIGLDAKAETS